MLARTIAEVAVALAGRSPPLVGVEVIQPNLEAVYLALTGRRYRDADLESSRAG